MAKQPASPVQVETITRLNRLRQIPAARRLFAETRLSVSDFIYPVFVTYGKGVRQEIPSMPGICRWSVDRLGEEVEEALGLGIPAVLLFGIPEHKDDEGSGAYDSQGPVQLAAETLRRRFPDLLVMTDVCLCEYTDHGHCGRINPDGSIDLASTLEALAQTALSHAEAGAQVVAPSDMMDGRVEVIRTALDQAGHTDVAIMAYSAKYCSAFYGPFREAAESTPTFGDRKSYQMAPPNRCEALLEAAADAAEGADILMVKPALAYLDVISQVKQAFDLPVAAYNVSGEYSMVKAAAQVGWMDGKKATMEILTAIKRAGAHAIITYHAKEVAGWLKEGYDPFA